MASSRPSGTGTPGPYPTVERVEAEADPRVERTRAAVLEAARALLFDEGWEAVTHLRVAEQAGVGRATLYRHWPRQSQLLHDVLAREAEMLHVTPTGILRDDLVAELDVFRHQVSESELGRLLATLVDRAEHEPELAQMKTVLVRNGTSVFREILHEGVQRGELAEDLDVDWAIGQLTGPLVYRRLLSGEPLTPTVVERTVDSFLTAHGAAPTTSTGP
jgi:AcrR family transcriptional regulator